MNRRLKKKKEKQLEEWLSTNYDYYDGVNYSTIPVRCYSCGYYESEDSSVGQPAGCTSPVIYDENDNIIPAAEEHIIKHMEHLGYGCPCFSKS